MYIMVTNGPFLMLMKQTLPFCTVENCSVDYFYNSLYALSRISYCNWFVYDNCFKENPCYANVSLLIHHLVVFVNSTLFDSFLNLYNSPSSVPDLDVLIQQK